MSKPMHIQFPGLDPIPILFEDRTVLAIDKPAGLSIGTILRE